MEREAQEPTLTIGGQAAADTANVQEVTALEHAAGHHPDGSALLEHEEPARTIAGYHHAQRRTQTADHVGQADLPACQRGGRGARISGWRDRFSSDRARSEPDEHE